VIVLAPARSMVRSQWALTCIQARTWAQRQAADGESYPANYRGNSFRYVDYFIPTSWPWDNESYYSQRGYVEDIWGSDSTGLDSRPRLTWQLNLGAAKTGASPSSQRALRVVPGFLQWLDAVSHVLAFEALGLMNTRGSSLLEQILPYSGDHQTGLMVYW